MLSFFHVVSPHCKGYSHNIFVDFFKDHFIRTVDLNEFPLWLIRLWGAMFWLIWPILIILVLMISFAFGLIMLVGSFRNFLGWIFFPQLVVHFRFLKLLDILYHCFHWPLIPMSQKIRELHLFSVKLSLEVVSCQFINDIGYQGNQGFESLKVRLSGLALILSTMI